MRKLQGIYLGLIGYVLNIYLLYIIQYLYLFNYLNYKDFKMYIPAINRYRYYYIIICV